jgi:hypothetical protein
MRVSRKTSFAAGAMAALVLGSGTAYAATGGSLILGMSNKAGATSVLSNKNGVALSLNSKSGTPSLKVNRSVKVPNLNADMVDGLSAGSLALAKGNTGHVTGAGSWVDFEGDGIDDAMVAFASCPAGTRLTGGGQTDFTATGMVVDSSPLGGGTWVVLAVGDPGDNASDLEAHAVCYNPRGAVSGAPAARMMPRTSEIQADYLREVGTKVSDRQ